MRLSCMQKLVHVTRGKKIAFHFNPGVLGALMNNYLRSPVTWYQFRDNLCLIQSSLSLIQKKKVNSKSQMISTRKCAFRNRHTVARVQLNGVKLGVTKHIGTEIP